MGLRNFVATYASKIGTDISVYDELPGHHLASIRHLITSTPDDSYPESVGEPVYGQQNPKWDYSGLQDLEAFLAFQAAADYCLTCSDDSSEGDYDPTQECFHVDVEEASEEDAADVVDPADAPPQTPPASPLRQGGCG